MMNDDDFERVWTTLQPTARERQRLDVRVFAWLEARDTPLVAEWFGLFKVSPFSAVGLLAAAAISLTTMPPVVWLALALL
jgi:hypothetical protein